MWRRLATGSIRIISHTCGFRRAFGRSFEAYEYRGRRVLDAAAAAVHQEIAFFVKDLGD